MGEKLSTNRAKRVYDYLLKKGINKNRMTYQGYGGTKPLVRFEKDSEDANKNRRVEIKVIKK
jgi:outer membrane protein OmpA-like peptidoglycan-associated protein